MQRLLEELRGVRSNFKFYLEDGTEGQRIVFQVGAGATILSVLFLSIFFVLLLRSAWSSAQVVFGGESLALLSSEEFSLFFVLLLLLLFILGVQGALLFRFLHRDKYFLTESGLSVATERCDFKNRRMVSEERVLLKREEGELGIYDHARLEDYESGMVCREGEDGPRTCAYLHKGSDYFLLEGYSLHAVLPVIAQFLNIPFLSDCKWPYSLTVCSVCLGEGSSYRVAGVITPNAIQFLSFLVIFAFLVAIPCFGLNYNLFGLGFVLFFLVFFMRPLFARKMKEFPCPNCKGAELEKELTP